MGSIETHGAAVPEMSHHAISLRCVGQVFHRPGGDHGLLSLFLGTFAIRRDTGKVISLTEPQMWTLIGVFATATFGMLTLMSTMFVRIIRAEIGGLRGEMNARFESVNHRLDGLDRDVQALTRRALGD